MSRQKKPACLAIDVDDSSMDFQGLLCRLMTNKSGVHVLPEDLKGWSWENIIIKNNTGTITGEDLRALFEKYEYEIYSAMLPFRYSRKALMAIKTDGYKIVFLTARPEKFRKVTKFSLMLHDLPYDKLVMNADKVAAIKELKKTYRVAAFIDDRAETVQAVADNCRIRKIFLIERGRVEDEEIDEGVYKIKDLIQVMRHI